MDWWGFNSVAAAWGLVGALLAIVNSVVLIFLLFGRGVCLLV